MEVSTQRTARPHARAAASIVRRQSAGIVTTAFDSAAIRELHLTVTPLPEEKPAETVRRLAELLRAEKAVIARAEVFGSLDVCAQMTDAFKEAFGAWPVTFVEGRDCAGGVLAGMHVLAIGGTTVGTVMLDGKPVGRMFRDATTRHLLIGDLRPSEPKTPRPVQTRQVFERLESVLKAARMGMSNVARTWFFLDDLLSWYGLFNEVRTRFFREQGMFDGLVPASTGVSGRNVSGSAAAVGAWAVEPLNGGAFPVCEVASPLQGPAPAYGSSFSRAVEMTTPELRRLMISGTASIEPDGRSVFQGDTAAQIDYTMQVVEGILRARGMGFGDVSRATAYIKHPADARLFAGWMERHGVKGWPVFCVEADICREDLLFEIELDALALNGKEGKEPAGPIGQMGPRESAAV